MFQKYQVYIFSGKNARQPEFISSNWNDPEKYDVIKFKLRQYNYSKLK